MEIKKRNLFDYYFGFKGIFDLKNKYLVKS